MYIDIIVNSRFRNKEVNPHPNEYKIESSLDMEVVESVQVINPSIPLTRPLINNTCNQMGVLDFLQNHLVINIPVGNYKKDPVVVCNAINTEMAQMTDQEIIMEYDENTCKYSITSNKDFSILWGEHNELARMLGFEQKTHNANIDFGCGRFKIVSKFIHNLVTSSCIQLVLPQISIFPMCVVSEGSTICPEMPIENSFDQLTCCFIDENNVSYDFQNHDHVFMLRFKLSSHVR